MSETSLSRSQTMDPNLVAPCGMNCNVCSSYLAWTHAIPKARGRISHCHGCGRNGKACAYLRKWCKPLKNEEVRFCFECADFPCHRLEHIDARYRTRYGASFIANLRTIQHKGIASFLRSQRREFRCDRCRTDVLSVHNRKCYRCDTIRNWKTRSMVLSKPVGSKRKQAVRKDGEG